MDSNYYSKDNCNSENEYIDNNSEKSKVKKSKNCFFVFLSIILGINYFFCLLIIIQPANTRVTVQKIPVTIGGKLYLITPGQNVTLKSPAGSVTYNVRFVNGKPVALDMTQHTSLIFGDDSGVRNKEKKDSNENNGNNGNNEKKDNKENNENNKKIEKTKSSETNRNLPLSDDTANSGILADTYWSESKKQKTEKKDYPPFYPELPEAAQTSYPIVFNIEIESDDEEDDDKEKEKEGNE